MFSIIFFFNFIFGNFIISIIKNSFLGSQKDIFTAAASGDLAFLKEQIEKNAVPINATDYNGNTALHWAAYKRQRPVVEYLLSKGEIQRFTFSYSVSLSDDISKEYFEMFKVHP
jgi:ankyrin repeat protein